MGAQPSTEKEKTTLPTSSSQEPPQLFSKPDSIYCIKSDGDITYYSLAFRHPPLAQHCHDTLAHHQWHPIKIDGQMKRENLYTVVVQCNSKNSQRFEDILKLVMTVSRLSDLREQYKEIIDPQQPRSVLKDQARGYVSLAFLTPQGRDFFLRSNSSLEKIACVDNNSALLNRFLCVVSLHSWLAYLASSPDNFQTITRDGTIPENLLPSTASTSASTSTAGSSHEPGRPVPQLPLALPAWPSMEDPQQPQPPRSSVFCADGCNVISRLGREIQTAKTQKNLDYFTQPFAEPYSIFPHFLDGEALDPTRAGTKQIDSEVDTALLLIKTFLELNRSYPINRSLTDKRYYDALSKNEKDDALHVSVQQIFLNELIRSYYDDRGSRHWPRITQAAYVLKRAWMRFNEAGTVHVEYVDEARRISTNESLRSDINTKIYEICASPSTKRAAQMAYPPTPPATSGSTSTLR